MPRHAGLDRRGTMALAQGEWLKAHENLIVTGQTGTGKSWLACAFGRQAARLDHSVLYARVPRLFEDLALARLDEPCGAVRRVRIAVTLNRYA